MPHFPSCWTNANSKHLHALTEEDRLVQDTPLPERPGPSSGAGRGHTDMEKPGPLAQTQNHSGGGGGHPRASLRVNPTSTETDLLLHFTRCLILLPSCSLNGHRPQGTPYTTCPLSPRQICLPGKRCHTLEMTLALIMLAAARSRPLVILCQPLFRSHFMHVLHFA